MGQEVSPLWGPAGVPVNAGAGPHFDVLEIGHEDFVALISADTAFWVLAPRDQALEYLLGPELPQMFLEKEARLASDLNNVRFGLLPSAVYFNPTERCNLDCGYCYLPREARRAGDHMEPARLMESLAILQDFFKSTLPEGARPQLVFHGSEPLLAKEAVFAGIEKYGDYFRFGVQTNATLLDQEAKDFLVAHGVGIGLSLDGPTAAVADRTRRTWGGTGVFAETVKALEELVDYPGLNLITTVTKENVRHLPELVDFLHARGVGNALLNPVRGTQTGGRDLMPDQAELAHFFFKALDRTYELAQKTGKKLVIGNFANLLLGLVAPGARRLMCDISPCGGGRCFFAVGAHGEVAPCSEFLGLPEFHGGNLWEHVGAGVAGDPAVQTDNHPGDGGLRALQPLRGAPRLRGALPGGGLCHQRAPGRPGAAVRLLHRPGAIRLPGHRPGPPGRLPLGRLEGWSGGDCGDVGKQ